MMSVARLFLSPDRQQYDLHDLNIPDLQHSHFTVENIRGLNIQCTIYSREQSQGLIIYAHGASGSRIDGIYDTLQISKMFNLDLCVFDFSGSGLSDGDIISLGAHYEPWDLDAVVAECRELGYQAIYLWGRSMGAVASLIFAAENQNLLSGLILDSPYFKLPELLRHNIKEHSSLILQSIGSESNFTTLLGLLRRQILKEIPDFDIEEFTLEYVAGNCQLPTLILHGARDRVVPQSHSKALFEKMGAAEKNFVQFEGNHNSVRPVEFYQAVSEFFNKRIPSADTFGTSFVPEQLLASPSDIYIIKKYTEADSEEKLESPRGAPANVFQSPMTLSPYPSILSIDAEFGVTIYEPQNGNVQVRICFSEFNQVSLKQNSVVCSYGNEKKRLAFIAGDRAEEIVEKFTNAQEVYERSRLAKLTPEVIENRLKGLIKRMLRNDQLDVSQLKKDVSKVLSTKTSIPMTPNEIHGWIDELVFRTRNEELASN